MSSDLILDRLAFGTLALITVIAALTFRDYGLGWDDFTHAQYGELLLAFYTSGFADTRALGFVNLYLYGGGFDMAAALFAKVLPFDLFETRRLLGAAIGLLGLFVTWRIARRIGGPFAGLIALVLLATCPLYYGHMFINPKDGPFAVAMAVLLLGLVRVLGEYPKPSWVSVLILGVGFGLSVGSRIIGGFGALYALTALVLLLAVEARGQGLRTAAARLGACGLRLIPGAIVAYALMALVWPWGVVDPLNPMRAIGIFAHFFEKPWQELFNGALLTPPDMPRSYLPHLMALKLPVIFWLLGLIGATGALIRSMQRGLQPPRRAIMLSIALAALLPIVIAVATRPAMYNGIRHFVFILPALAVAGGLAANWFRRRARHGMMRGVLAALLIAGLTTPIVQMVRLHPYEYANFNLVAGGVRGARERYMVDYWGLSFKQAAQALRAKLSAQGERPPDGRQWTIAVCGPHPPAAVALGAEFEPTWDPKGADFALMLGEFYCAKLDMPLLVDIERGGVTFARVYDIRGRHVPRLFTIAPVERDEPPPPVDRPRRTE